MIDAWTHDLRLAWRSLRRVPGLAAAAVLTLSVGVTGVVVTFALIEGVLLRPLPVSDEARLFVGWRTLPEPGARRWPFRTTDLDLLRRESQLLEAVEGVGYNDPGPVPVLESGVATFVSTARVTGGFFQALGVSPRLGRVLMPDDDVTGAENVLVLGHGLWQRRYGGALDVLGRRVRINDQPFTIVGVMPPDVDYPRGVEAWTTVAAMQTTTSNPLWKYAMASELDLLARVRPGVTEAQAGAELRTLGSALDAQQDPGNFRGTVPMLEPYRESLVGDVRQALLAVFAAVGLVALIAGANVAHLLLVRGESRRPEFAVRAALGASGGRLVRHVLAESVVLAVVAGVVGLGTASVALPALLRWVPDGLPRMDAVRIDAGVAVFSMGVAFFVASLSALVPARVAWRFTLTGQLGGVSRSAVGPASRRGRRALTVTQVALAVTVVAAAGLLTRSLLRLQEVGVRLASNQLVYAPLSLPQDTYADRERQRRFVTELAAQLEAVPAITAATPINVIPFAGVGWDVPTFTAEGQSAERARTNPTLNLEEIHPSYFETFEVPLVRGRAFTEFDRDGTLVAIVSDDVAARTWPGEDLIGKRLKMGDVDSKDPWRTVVGVAAATRYLEIREPRATLCLPATQMLGAAHDLVIRTSLTVAVVGELVRARALALDPEVEVMPLTPFTELVDATLARPRFNAFLVALFGAAGLALAAVGLYAVMATMVRYRRREIGVRLAMGATPGDVRRLVLGEGVRLVAVGVVLGLLLAMLGTRVVRGLLFGVQPLDPVSFGITVCVLAAVSMVAMYLPVRQASRVDPASILRAE